MKLTEFMSALPACGAVRRIVARRKKREGRGGGPKKYINVFMKRGSFWYGIRHSNFEEHSLEVGNTMNQHWSETILDTDCKSDGTTRKEGSRKRKREREKGEREREGRCD